MSSDIQNGEKLAEIVDRLADDAVDHFSDVDSFADAAARAIADADYVDLSERKVCQNINHYGPSDKGQRYGEFKRVFRENDIQVDGESFAAFWRLRMMVVNELLDRFGDG